MIGSMTYRFWLTGACNTEGDWSDFTGAVPEVTVTWEMIPVEMKTQEETEQLQENAASERKEEPEDEKAAESDGDVGE